MHTAGILWWLTLECVQKAGTQVEHRNFQAQEAKNNAIVKMSLGKNWVAEATSQRAGREVIRTPLPIQQHIRNSN